MVTRFKVILIRASVKRCHIEKGQKESNAHVAALLVKSFQYKNTL